MQSAKKLTSKIIVDCSHANGATVEPPFKKNFKLQTTACEAVAKQIAEGEKDIKGIMMESHLIEGNQPLNPGKTDVSTLKYGMSVTDGCVNFETTATALRSLAEAVRSRRNQNGSPAKKVKQ